MLRPGFKALDPAECAKDKVFSIRRRRFATSNVPPMSSARPQPVVLLVEDSDDDAFFFKRTLRQAGFTGALEHASDGGAARAHLEKVAAGGSGAPPVPDLVFLDLKLPTFSGFEILEWIATQHFNPPLDVAVLSGSEQSADVSRAIALGASTYYVKPILLQQLKARLAAWQERQAASVPGHASPPSAVRA